MPTRKNNYKVVVYTKGVRKPHSFYFNDQTLADTFFGEVKTFSNTNRITQYSFINGWWEPGNYKIN